MSFTLPHLEDGLNHLAVIRSTFETIDSFPEDEELRADLMVMVVEARDALRHQLSASREQLRKPDEETREEDLSLKDELMKLIEPGISGQRIREAIKLPVFQSSQSLWVWPLPLPHSRTELSKLSGRNLLGVFLESLIQCSDNDHLYTDGRTFETEFYEPYLALMYARYLAWLSESPNSPSTAN